MRKIEKEMIQALEANRRFNKSNTAIEWETMPSGTTKARVYLHGNEIARILHTDNGVIARVKISMAGWATPTTRSRLNAVLESTTQGHCSVRQVKGKQQFVVGALYQEVCADKWYTVL